MGADKARLALTDEPFNVKIGGHVTGGDHREFVMASGEMTDARIPGVQPRLDQRATPLSRRRRAVWHFRRLARLADCSRGGDRSGPERDQPHRLGKDQRRHGQSLSFTTRIVAPLQERERRPREQYRARQAGQTSLELLGLPGTSSLGSDARRGLTEHPTVKPTALLEDALIDLTNRGEIVLEPFGGSGSMLIVCERTGRLCRCLSSDPLHVDVIIRRYQELPGQKAVLRETGGTFDDLAKSRQA